MTDILNDQENIKYEKPKFEEKKKNVLLQQKFGINLMLVNGVFNVAVVMAVDKNIGLKC